MNNPNSNGGILPRLLALAFAVALLFLSIMGVHETANMFVETLSRNQITGWRGNYIEDYLVSVSGFLFCLAFSYMSIKACIKLLLAITDGNNKELRVPTVVTASLLAIVLIALLGYKFIFSAYYLECEARFGYEHLTSNNTRIFCLSPLFDITCTDSSFVKIDNEITCVSGNKKKYVIKDNAFINVKYCIERHGELSEATGKNRCRCSYGAEMKDNRCVNPKTVNSWTLEVDKREQMALCQKKLGPNATIEKIQGEWECRPKLQSENGNQ